MEKKYRKRRDFFKYFMLTGMALVEKDYCYPLYFFFIADI